MKNVLISGLCLFVVANAFATQTNYDFSAITAKVQGWVAKGYFPGATMLVAKDNHVIYEKSFDYYTPKTEVYIASAGKWLAAATIMSLVDDDKLSLDDHPSTFLPEFKDNPEDKATLRQMLSHTSGYQPYQPPGKPVDDYQTLAESVNHILPLPLKYQPGERFDYGGLALQVAGRMAEVASGRDWETLFQERIAKPCDMTNTHFTPVDSAGGHNPMLGGGAESNLHDYANFLSMIFNNGVFNGQRVLSTKAIRAMQADQLRGAFVMQPEFPGRVRNAKHSAVYGLGEWREELDANGDATLISSPSWAGAYPWIDKTSGVYGVLIAHVGGPGVARDHFSGFYSGPVLAQMVRDVVASGADFSRVDAQIQKWIDEKDYAGAGLWIVSKDGKTLHETYWGGYTRETTVMIASATKWLEAATLMTLVDQGKMDLDKPIFTYLPEMKNSSAGENTLRQMFAHTSSLNHIDINDKLGIDTFPAQLAAGHTDVKPGQEFYYGGTDLATAARAVEVVAGKPWLTVFGENIATQCNMKKTVTGHNLWTYSNIIGGDLFPCSDAVDYMNFLRMILNDGVFDGKRVLSTNAIDEMEADQIRGAFVKQPEYPEQTLGQKQRAIYGLGEWRLVLDDQGNAMVLSSPSFAGFFPWIDKRHSIAGVFVARANGWPKIDTFRASAVLVPLVSEVLDGNK